MNEQQCRGVVKRRACTPLGLDPLLEFVPCEVCGGFVNDYEMHHRKFRSRGGRWTPANCLLLCKPCHGGATIEKLWASTRGLNVHSWEDPRAVPVQLWWSEDMLLLNDDGGWQRYSADHVDDAGRTR